MEVKSGYNNIRQWWRWWRWWWWWCTPLIPVLENQRQVDFCKFNASLVYIMSSRTARPKL